MSRAFGPHLIGDLAGCDTRLMNDREAISDFLLDLTDRLGLVPMGRPHLDLYSGPHKEWDGYSGTIHIETSHITAHFFAFGYVFIDIFSCKQFDEADAKNFIRYWLGATEERWQTVHRGAFFPTHLMEDE